MILLWLAAHPWAALAIMLAWTASWAAGSALWGRAIGRDEGYDEGYEDGLRDGAAQVAHTTSAPIYCRCWSEPDNEEDIAPVTLALPPAAPAARPPTREEDERVAGPATSAALYCAAELNHLLQAVPEDWRR